MSMISYMLLLIPLALIIFLVLKLKKTAPKQAESSEMVASATLSGARKVNMGYEEALEASKQFIYNIIKAVMQKFTPTDITTLLGLGKTLAAKGVKYMHVVDVQALQYQKFVQSKQQTTSRSTGRG